MCSALSGLTIFQWLVQRFVLGFKALGDVSVLPGKRVESRTTASNYFNFTRLCTSPNEIIREFAAEQPIR